MKILVAEDDHVSQMMVERYIVKEGYTVVLCDNGEDAFNIIKQQEVRMAIIDWIMPKMDGVTLCEEIRKLHLPRYTYLIMLTSKSETHDLVEALDSGADDFISKPVERAELVSRIKVGTRILKLEDDLIQSRKELIRLAREDSLTNLFNRRAFHDESVKEMDRAFREGQTVSLVMIDIDNFKLINDKYGHQSGDLVLIEIARRLHSLCRPYDILGRFGGEEFIILLPKTTASSASKIAERIRYDIFNKPIDVRGGEINVTISIGLSNIFPVFGPRDAQIDDLIKRADIALYRAKRDGKNKVAVNVK